MLINYCRVQVGHRRSSFDKKEIKAVGGISGSEVGDLGDPSDS